MKESDIRPTELFEEYLRLSAEDVMQYFPNDTNREARSCPGCAGLEYQQCFEKNGFQVVECRACQTLFINPGPTDVALASFYRESPSQKYWANTFFPAVRAARQEKIFRPRAEKIKNLILQYGMHVSSIVDVGAGAGIMLEELRATGIKANFQAIEPTPELAETCRNIDIETYEGFANEAGLEPSMRGKASLVISFEVIEHVISTENFVNDLALLAAPGGYILFTGLCGTGFDIMQLGRRSKSISPPHHLNFLSQKGVSLLLNRCGLKEISFTTPGVLDVDIVRNAYKKENDVISNAFLKGLFSADDEITLGNFQEFVTNNNLSSHMWVLAQRPI